MTKSSCLGLALLVVACATSLSTSLSTAQPSGWGTYHDDEFGYELQHPAGWKVIPARPRTDNTSGRAGNVLSPDVLRKVTFQEPQGRVWPGEFVVLIREHVEGQTLDEWADTNFTDVHDESLVNSVEDTTLGGRAASLFRVFGFDHTSVVVAFVRDRKVYEIRYTGSTPNDPDLAEHRSIYEHMKQSFRLVEAEAFDLGGPCDDGAGPLVADFYAKLGEAARNGDHQQKIDLQKRFVRAMCSNEYRWHGLAEAYLDAGRTDMAIQVLHGLHRRGAEIKPSTFRDQENLARLLATPEFQRSELGRELRALQREAVQRNAEYRRQLQALDAAARPQESFVTRGACPFECCSYREWDVLETTPLHDAPFGTVVVGSAVKGRRVRGVTGDVHLRPAPVAVVHDHAPFVQGEIFFVLDYVGEGYYRYWRNGEIAEDELWIDDVCLRPSRNCWAEYIEAAEDRPEPRWWILIETDLGLRGWSDRSEHFGNKDACG